MGEKKGGRVWLWVLIGIVALAAIGYGWYRSTRPEVEKERVAVEITVSEESPSAESTKADLVTDEKGKPAGDLNTGDNLSETGNVPGGQTTDSAAGKEETFVEPPGTGKLVEYQFKSAEKKMPVKDESAQDGLKKDSAADGVKDAEPAADTPEIRYCRIINQYVQDYFEYLDTKPYIQKLIPGETAYAHFKQIMERLTANPPHSRRGRG